MNLAAPTEAPAGLGPAGLGPAGTAVVPPRRGPPSLVEVARHFPELEIIDCLGCGGMGVVYKARQPHLNRLIALKILAPDKEQDPAFTERFTREAQTLARLNHPHIVTLYDFGKADGWFFLLLEFVDGVSLRQLLQRKKLSPEEALAIVPTICEALQYAHEHGVVHRDIKPENVLLNSEGRIKIADFGIAKIVGGDVAQPAITQEEQVIGTPHYMAPEQVEHPKLVDHRADIYSLGVVFYEMLTGELPLGKFAPPSQHVQVDVRLDQVVLHALEKDPNRRYQHASDVKTDVETITTTRSPAAAASHAAEPATPLSFAEHDWVRTVRWSARLLGASLVLFLAVIIGLHLVGLGLPPLALEPGGTILNYLALALMVSGIAAGWKFDGAAAVVIALGWVLWHGSNGSLAWSMVHLALVVGALFALCWWASQGRHSLILITTAGVLLVLLVCGMSFLPTNVHVYGTVRDAVTRQPISTAELSISRDAGPPSIQARNKGGTAELLLLDPTASSVSVIDGKPARTSSGGVYALHVGWYERGKKMRVFAPGYEPLQVALGPKPLRSRRIPRDVELTPVAAANPVDSLTELLSDPWWGPGFSEKIAAAYSEELLARMINGNSLMRLAFALYDTGRYSDAFKVFCRLEQVAYPDVALVWQGHMLDLLNRRPEALAVYANALKAPPDDYRHDQYGLVLNRSYLEQRLKTPFVRVEYRQAAKPIEPTASAPQNNSPP